MNIDKQKNNALDSNNSSNQKLPTIDYNVPLPKQVEKKKEQVKQIIIHDYDF